MTVVKAILALMAFALCLNAQPSPVRVDSGRVRPVNPNWWWSGRVVLPTSDTAMAGSLKFSSGTVNVYNGSAWVPLASTSSLVDTTKLAYLAKANAFTKLQTFDSSVVIKHGGGGLKLESDAGHGFYTTIVPPEIFSPHTITLPEQDGMVLLDATTGSMVGVDSTIYKSQFLKNADSTTLKAGLLKNADSTTIKNNLVNTYVPYAGATTNLNLGTKTIASGTITGSGQIKTSYTGSGLAAFSASGFGDINGAFGDTLGGLGTSAGRATVHIGSHTAHASMSIGQSATAAGSNFWIYNASEASGYYRIGSLKGMAFGVSNTYTVPSAATNMTFNATTFTFTTGSITSTGTGSNITIAGTGTSSVAGLFTADSLKSNKGIRSGSATNYATIDSVNGLRLAGSATVWDDLQVSLTAGKQGALDKPLWVSDSCAFKFLADSTEVVYGNAELPHDWKLGTDVHAHIHYQQTSAADTPSFSLTYKWHNLGQAIDPTWHYIRLKTRMLTYSSGAIIQLLEGLTDMAGVNKTLSSVILYRLKRENADGGLTNSYVYNLGFHYEKDSMGSNSELSK